MQRMVRYHKCIEKGMIHVDAVLEVVFETPISAVIDGHDCMGQLVGKQAMEMAIQTATTTGVGIVSVRNSNHYGIAGYYAKMACDQGLMGFSCNEIVTGSQPLNCGLFRIPRSRENLLHCISLTRQLCLQLCMHRW